MQPPREQTSIQCSTPLSMNTSYTSIYFEENQLLPGSIGISPLITAHPPVLHGWWVRSSIPISRNFNLAIISSPGFGFCVCYKPLLCNGNSKSEILNSKQITNPKFQSLKSLFKICDLKFWNLFRI